MPVAFDTAGMERHDDRTWFDPRTGDQVSLTYIGMVPDLPAPLDDLPRLRRALAEETAETGAIIEAHVVQLGGLPALLQLIKLPIPGQDTGLAFIAAFTVPKATCSAVLRVQCTEGQMTGMRESTVAAQVGFENCFPPHPYAPGLHGQLPYNVADEATWDQQFPDHPLTRARAWAHRTLATAHIDPRFAALPPFDPTDPAERTESLTGLPLPPAPLREAPTESIIDPNAVPPAPEPVFAAAPEPPPGFFEPSPTHSAAQPAQQDAGLSIFEPDAAPSPPTPTYATPPTPEPFHAPDNPLPVPDPGRPDTPAQAQSFFEPATSSAPNQPTYPPDATPPTLEPAGSYFEPDNTPPVPGQPTFAPDTTPAQGRSFFEPATPSVPDRDRSIFEPDTAPPAPERDQPVFEPDAALPAHTPGQSAFEPGTPSPPAPDQSVFEPGTPSPPAPDQSVFEPDTPSATAPRRSIFEPDAPSAPSPGQSSFEPDAVPSPPLQDRSIFEPDAPSPDQSAFEPDAPSAPVPGRSIFEPDDAPARGQSIFEPAAAHRAPEPAQPSVEAESVRVEAEAVAVGSGRRSLFEADGGQAADASSSAGPGEASRAPVEAGDVLRTVLVGLPLGGYLPLWQEDGVTFWKMSDPAAVRARLGSGVESRSEIDKRRFREAAMFSPSRGTLFLMDRYRDESGHLGGTSTQLTPATEEEAYAAVDDKALSELYVWLGDVVLDSVRRGEFVAVESGGWQVPMTPVLLVMLRTDGRSWHSVVETSPVPVGAPVWRDQQPVEGNTQVLASPATEKTIRAAGLLTRFAVATWGMHPFQLGLSFGPNPTLQQR